MQVKFLERCWASFEEITAILRVGSHERFLLAWHAGEIFSAWRNQCDHGNSRIVKKGDGITLPDKVEQETSLDPRTAYRWADLWDFICPKDPNIDFDALTEEPALDIVGECHACIVGDDDTAARR